MLHYMGKLDFGFIDLWLPLLGTNWLTHRLDILCRYLFFNLNLRLLVISNKTENVCNNYTSFIYGNQRPKIN